MRRKIIEAMIVPIVPEEDWLEMLRTCPEWERSRSSALIIAPHPDDETLATGGLISAMRSDGQDVLVAAVTAGENAYKDARPLGEVRATEQRNALEILGVPPTKTVRLRFPDSDVAAHQQALVASLLSLAVSSTHIIAPWPADYHPDHEACGRAAQAVARLTGVRLTFYFFWNWHCGTIDVLKDEKLRTFPLSPAAKCARAEALDCHASQLHRESGEPILSERLLAPARRPFEVYLDA
jgi:LmbE family N-acetylglucosaminyl deacetylase